MNSVCSSYRSGSIFILLKYFATYIVNALQQITDNSNCWRITDDPNEYAVIPGYLGHWKENAKQLYAQ